MAHKATFGLCLLASVFAFSAAASLTSSLNQLESGLGSKYTSAYQSCVAVSECKGTVDGVQTQLGQVADGFNAATELSNGISNALGSGKWSNVGSKISKVSSFLAAAGPLVSIVGAFMKSTEQQLLEELLATINRGFERMEARFTDIENQLRNVENTINEQHFWTRLSPSLTELNEVGKKIERYAETTDLAAREERKNELDQHEYDMLFSGISAIEGAFKGETGNTLCHDVRDFTDINLKKVIQIAGDLFERLLRATQNHILLAEMLNKADVAQSRSDWQKLLREISDIIQDCEDGIRTVHWKNQWQSDVDTVLNPFTSPGKVNEVATNLYNMLTSKYFFKEWLVVVYDEIKGSRYHYWGTCGKSSGETIERMHFRNKYNIIVSWVPPTKAKAYTALRWQKLTMMSMHLFPGMGSPGAKTLYEKMDPFFNTGCTCMIRGVIGGANGFKTKSPDQRLVYFEQRYESTTYRAFCLG